MDLALLGLLRRVSWTLSLLATHASLAWWPKLLFSLPWGVYISIFLLEDAIHLRLDHQSLLITSTKPPFLN